MTAEARSYESATDSHCEVAGRFSMVTRAQDSDVSGWMNPRPYSVSTMRVRLHKSIGVAVCVAPGQFWNPGTQCPPIERVPEDWRRDRDWEDPVLFILNCTLLELAIAPE
jgi:hypothetical protein